jgi:hypothetical protein
MMVEGDTRHVELADVLPSDLPAGAEERPDGEAFGSDLEAGSTRYQLQHRHDCASPKENQAEDDRPFAQSSRDQTGSAKRQGD